uniref:Bifunctional inhibitor/plant lipid transfer protein/seed storage helical domain-containing protein n=1 Tax=Nymphaea colorata TaxID=210225 RepID=A0A5K1G0P6_9MAGN
MGRSGTWTAMFVVAVAMLGVVAAVDLCAPAPQPAPPPGPDCYSIVLAMADCLGFVQNGSTQAKPSAACCDGMKSVLKQGPQCLCLVLRDSGSLGIAVNTTKALELPGACGVSAPRISQCYGAGATSSSLSLVFF